MRFRAKRDANEKEIVAALETHGFKVLLADPVVKTGSRGLPDLVVYCAVEGCTFQRFIEVKTPRKDRPNLVSWKKGQKEVLERLGGAMARNPDEALLHCEHICGGERVEQS